MGEAGEQRRGFLLGVAAYAIWGLFPLYWPLLEPTGAVEILAHRICWSMLTMVALVVGLRRLRSFRTMLGRRRTVVLLAIAAVVISLNWGGFIYGVNTERVVEVSLGYFVNPLVTVLLGVLVLGERLRRVQWAALALATVAVVILTVDYGHPPWVAILLAGSFGTYGLLKKKAGAPAVESLAFETAVLAPVALVFLLVLAGRGEGSLVSEGWPHALLLAGTGIVTAVPLICFGAAATRVPMTTLGLLQYLAPTLQFVIGVVLNGETMTTVRWVGFVLVWTALAIFTVEAVLRSRHHRSSATNPLVDEPAVAPARG